MVEQIRLLGFPIGSDVLTSKSGLLVLYCTMVYQKAYDVVRLLLVRGGFSDEEAGYGLLWSNCGDHPIVEWLDKLRPSWIIDERTFQLAKDKNYAKSNLSRCEDHVVVAQNFLPSADSDGKSLDSPWKAFQRQDTVIDHVLTFVVACRDMNLIIFIDSKQKLSQDQGYERFAWIELPGRSSL